MWNFLSTDRLFKDKCDMKRIYDIMRFVCLAGVIMLTACTGDDEVMPMAEKEGAVVYPTLKVCVSQMDMVASSRAVSPMNPDQEKYVKTIAVFEFDNEDWHEKGDYTYHFIDFVAGTVDGATGVGDVHKTEYGIVETTLNGLAFEARENGKICLVANITEDDVDIFYDNCSKNGQSRGSITFAQFKEWALPFTYKESTSDVYDESVTGYIEDMYMFGYYEGPIDPATVGEIRVDLGRLASRLDITVVNETGADIEKRLGYHFDNVCHSAYFFPLLSSMPPTIGAGLSRTVICAGVGDPVEGDPDFKVVPATFKNGDDHTRYYYVAAHSAAGYKEATKLHLFYDRRIVDDQPGDSLVGAWVPLCNVHPLQAATVTNGYSLSRNTRYHFTIRLKSKAAAPASRAAAASRRPEVEYGKDPGDITVYLPD